MNSLLLTTLARGLFGILLCVSIYLLYRGHNAPGGGFIGGLVAAVAYALAAKAKGISKSRSLLRVRPMTLVAIGMLAILLSGLGALMHSEPYMTGQWLFLSEFYASLGAALSTILLFDTGVFLIVLGATLSFFFALEDAES